LNYPKWCGCASTLVGAGSKSGPAETWFIFKTTNTVSWIGFAFPNLVVPSSVISGKSIHIVPKMKQEPGLEDEDRPFDAQRQCPPPPTSLLTTVKHATNTCWSTAPGKIVGTHTLYLEFSIVSHEANIILPLWFFAFPFFRNGAYSFLDNHNTVEHKTQTWTFSFN